MMVIGASECFLGSKSIVQCCLREDGVLGYTGCWDTEYSFKKCCSSPVLSTAELHQLEQGGWSIASCETHRDGILVATFWTHVQQALSMLNDSWTLPRSLLRGFFSLHVQHIASCPLGSIFFMVKLLQIAADASWPEDMHFVKHEVIPFYWQPALIWVESMLPVVLFRLGFTWIVESGWRVFRELKELRAVGVKLSFTSTCMDVDQKSVTFHRTLSEHLGLVPFPVHGVVHRQAIAELTKQNYISCAAGCCLGDGTAACCLSSVAAALVLAEVDAEMASTYLEIAIKLLGFLAQAGQLFAVLMLSPWPILDLLTRMENQKQPLSSTTSTDPETHVSRPEPWIMVGGSRRVARDRPQCPPMLADNPPDSAGFESCKDKRPMDWGLASAAARLMSPSPDTRVLELGAGCGCYTDFFRYLGFDAVACDGTPDIHTLTNGLVAYCDLSKPLISSGADWVFMLGISDHASSDAEHVLFETIQSHARIGIILSWTSGQAEKNLGAPLASTADEYLIKRMSSSGFNFDSKATVELRRNAGILCCPSLKNDVFVFRRASVSDVSLIPKHVPLPGIGLKFNQFSRVSEISCWRHAVHARKCCFPSSLEEVADSHTCWDGKRTTFGRCCGTIARSGSAIERCNQVPSILTDTICDVDNYSPGDIEILFLSNVAQATSEDALCSFMDSSARQSWILQNRGCEPISTRVFSKLCKKGQPAEIIEPLAGLLRDPRLMCEGRFGGFVDWLLFADGSYLEKSGRNRFFDAGGSKFSMHLQFFLSEYAARGIEFHEIFVWEATRQGSLYWEGVAAEVRNELEAKLTLFDGISATASLGRGAEHNPVDRIFKECKPHDFCVLKLAMNEPLVEIGLVRQLLRQSNLTRALLDEFFWEDHPRGPLQRRDSIGTYGTTYRAFQRLRQLGVRAHPWI